MFTAKCDLDYPTIDLCLCDFTSFQTPKNQTVHLNFDAAQCCEGPFGSDSQQIVQLYINNKTWECYLHVWLCIYGLCVTCRSPSKMKKHSKPSFKFAKRDKFYKPKDKVHCEVVKWAVKHASHCISCIDVYSRVNVPKCVLVKLLM